MCTASPFQDGRPSVLLLVYKIDATMIFRLCQASAVCSVPSYSALCTSATITCLVTAVSKPGGSAVSSLSCILCKNANY